MLAFHLERLKGSSSMSAIVHISDLTQTTDI
jgi:hypothetical protein